MFRIAHRGNPLIARVGEKQQGQPAGNTDNPLGYSNAHGYQIIQGIVARNISRILSLSIAERRPLEFCRNAYSGVAVIMNIIIIINAALLMNRSARQSSGYSGQALAANFRANVFFAQLCPGVGKIAACAVA